ncbi:MAG: hypothetical protein ABRQ26_04875 [Syntrophomonadaceae bacterium]
MYASSYSNHSLKSANDKPEPFVVTKLGSVRGTPPVSIISKHGDSFLAVYDDALFNKKALIYRLNNLNQPYRQLKGAVSSLDHMHFSSSGRLLAAANYFSQFQFSGFIYDIEKDHLKPVRADRYYGKASIGGGSQMFCLNHDESLMAIASSIYNNSRLKIFNLASPKEPTVVFTLNPPGKLFETKSLNWSPDGTIIAHHGHYMNKLIPAVKLRGIFIWKVESYSPSLSFKHIGTLTYESHNRDDNMVDLVFSPDCRSLVLGADKNSSDKIKLFDLVSQQLVFESAPIGATTTSLLYTPNGRYLISGEKDGCIRIWRVEPSFLTLYKTIALSGEIFQLFISAQGNNLLIAHQDGKKAVGVSTVSLPAEMMN